MNLSRLATIGAPGNGCRATVHTRAWRVEVYGWYMRRSDPVRTGPPAVVGSATRLPSDSTLAGVAAVGAGGFALAILLDVTGGTVGLPCLLRSTTGLNCPLCGATRMAAALLHGDLGAALRFNAPALVGGRGGRLPVDQLDARTDRSAHPAATTPDTQGTTPPGAGAGRGRRRCSWSPATCRGHRSRDSTSSRQARTPGQGQPGQGQSGEGLPSQVEVLVTSHDLVLRPERLGHLREVARCHAPREHSDGHEQR